jgi:hypothetical protein
MAAPLSIHLSVATRITLFILFSRYLLDYSLFKRSNQFGSQPVNHVADFGVSYRINVPSAFFSSFDQAHILEYFQVA